MGNNILGCIDHYVLKVSKQNVLEAKEENEQRSGRTEGDIAEIAGEIGIGPQVYHHGVCKTNKTTQYHYIVMDLIRGNPLSNESWENLINQIVPILAIIIQFYLEHGILHYDVHFDNVFKEKKTGELKLIDYARSVDKFYLERQNERNTVGIQDSELREWIWAQNLLLSVFDRLMKFLIEKIDSKTIAQLRSIVKMTMKNLNLYLAKLPCLPRLRIFNIHNMHSP